MSLLCFFGHHRSASSWTNDILRTICISAGWRHQVVHNAKMFKHLGPEFCAKTKRGLLTFSNAKYDYIDGLKSFIGLHIVRDPRDILISSYFSHRNSHSTDQWPELAAHRNQLQAISEAEGLLLEIECRREEFEDMVAWQYNSPFIYELKMEDLTQEPQRFFSELFLFWNRSQPSMNEKIERRQVAFNRTL